MNHTISVDLSKPNEFMTTHQHYNTCRNSRLFIEVKSISVSIYELNVVRNAFTDSLAFHFICIRDDRTKKSYVQMDAALLLLAHSTRWNDNNGIVNDTIWTHSLSFTHSGKLRQHQTPFVCVCFPFICPIWKATFIIVILLASLPHHLCFVVLRTRIAPIKLCRLFAYAQIYTNFFFIQLQRRRCLCLPFSLILMSLLYGREAQPFVAPSIMNEIILLFIFFLVRSAIMCSGSLFFCIQKGKQRMASCTLLWVRCIFHYAIFFQVFSLFCSTVNNSYIAQQYVKSHIGNRIKVERMMTKYKNRFFCQWRRYLAWIGLCWLGIMRATHTATNNKMMAQQTHEIFSVYVLSHWHIADWVPFTDFSLAAQRHMHTHVAWRMSQFIFKHDEFFINPDEMQDVPEGMRFLSKS